MYSTKVIKIPDVINTKALKHEVDLHDYKCNKLWKKIDIFNFLRVTFFCWLWMQMCFMMGILNTTQNLSMLSFQAITPLTCQAT